MRVYTQKNVNTLVPWLSVFRVKYQFERSRLHMPVLGVINLVHGSRVFSSYW